MVTRFIQQAPNVYHNQSSKWIILHSIFNFRQDLPSVVAVKDPKRVVRHGRHAASRWDDGGIRVIEHHLRFGPPWN